MTELSKKLKNEMPEEGAPSQRKPRSKPKPKTGYLFCPSCYGSLEHDEQDSFCEKCERRFGSS